MTALSAPRIGEAVAWVGGTLLPDLNAVAEEIACGSTATCDVEQRLRIRPLVDELIWGKTTPDAFIRGVGVVCDPPLAPELAATRFLAAVHVQPGMVALFNTLSLYLPLRFVSDYPRPWLAKLAAGGKLGSLLDVERAVYTADLAADRATWCRALITASLLTPGRSLWIDHSTRRAVVALRHGVDAALCEDAKRLSRDLSLWRL